MDRSHRIPGDDILIGGTAAIGLARAHALDCAPLRSSARADCDNRLPGLDLLRGIAALGVLWFHLADTAIRLDPSFPRFLFGARGVEIFFTISGYVILLTARRTPDRRAFTLARWTRLYPTFVICMCITTAWVLACNIVAFEVSPAAWIANLTMLPGLFGARYVDLPYWTLGFEVAFYALVVVFLPWIKRGYALHLCAVYLALVPLLPAVTDYATFFAVGIALYELGQGPIRSARGLVAIAVLITALIVGHHLDTSLVAPLIVAIALRAPAPGWLASWAGGVSYPLYLLHCYIGSSLVVFYGGSLGSVIFAAFSVTLLAVCVHHFLEKPILRALRSRFARHRPDRDKAVPA